MMMHSYTCIFTTPSQSAPLEGLSSVIVPGTEGKVGLLPRHAPMVIKLKSGIVSLYKQENVWRHYFVWGGLVMVSSKECEIFTESFTLLEELDPLVLAEDLERYHNDLAGVTIEDDRRAISYKIAITEAMLKALKDHNGDGQDKK
jgi:F-type H+-transporting ATPase subunit epsilon